VSEIPSISLRLKFRDRNFLGPIVESNFHRHPGEQIGSRPANLRPAPSIVASKPRRSRTPQRDSPTVRPRPRSKTSTTRFTTRNRSGSRPREATAWPLGSNCSPADTQHSAPSAAAAPAQPCSPYTAMAKAGRGNASYASDTPPGSRSRQSCEMRLRIKMPSWFRVVRRNSSIGISDIFEGHAPVDKARAFDDAF
jgi:hypothetical protein